jgi:hypothetical protein
VIGFLALVHACQVPVFRYALERWTSDKYRVVLTPGTEGWTEEEKEALDLLTSLARSGDVPVNLTVQEGERSSGAPDGRMELFYPGYHPGVVRPPIWKGRLTRDNVRSLLDSPLRRELAKRILEGQSAIWLIVESGNEEADAAAEALLNEASQYAGGKLEIPEGVVGRDEIEAGKPLPLDQENVLQSDVPLKIEFSVLRVGRDDPAEQIFLPMLLNLEDDLHEWASDPMAFPIFGRGRVLEPLIAKGIARANILEDLGYLCGACSCEVKDQNPGMDLLMAVNWDAAIEGSEIILEKVLPPLEGTAVFLSGASVEAEGTSSATPPEEVLSEAGESGQDEPVVSRAVRPLAISLIVVVVLVGVGTVLQLRRNRK